MEGDWRPSPKFILRRDAVRWLTRRWSPGSFLEVGAGTGTITRTFLNQGYQGACWDVTPENRAVLRRNLSGYGAQAVVPETLPSASDTKFDYIFAFEVLEHIRDDKAALSDWSRRLRPGGRALISVPAHQRKFSRDDEFVGHYRRYEREGVKALLADAGYHDIRVINYGFPLGNIAGLVSRTLALAGSERDNLGKETKSTESGIRRSKSIRLIGALCNDFWLAPFRLVQRPFFGLDIGDGYVAEATLRG